MLVRCLFQDKLVSCQVRCLSMSLWILVAGRKEDCLVAVLAPPAYVLGKVFPFLSSCFEVSVHRTQMSTKSVLIMCHDCLVNDCGGEHC